MPGPRDWQDRYYDGEADDIFENFADEGTPEDQLDTGWHLEYYEISEEEFMLMLGALEEGNGDAGLE